MNVIKIFCNILVPFYFLIYASVYSFYELISKGYEELRTKKTRHGIGIEQLHKQSKIQLTRRRSSRENELDSTLYSFHRGVSIKIHERF